MAPIPVPNPAYYTITGNVATIRPTGVDDWDNIQTLFDTAGLTDIRFAAGRFYSRYQLVLSDYQGKISGAGKRSTILQAGLESSRIELLDDADRALYNPQGMPCGLLIRQSLAGGQSSDVVVGAMGFETSPLKGYHAIGFGWDEQNFQVESLIRVTGRYGCTTKFNVELTMTGVIPQPTGDLNITDVQVHSGQFGAGTQYTEGVDYTVDLAAGTVTRIGGGAIGDGAPVYVNYNNARNYNDITRADVKFTDCFFKQYNWTDANGVLHASATDVGFYGQGGRPFKKVADPYSVTANIAVIEGAGAPYNVAAWNRNSAGAYTPLNGNIEISDCEFEDFPWCFFDQLTGAQIAGLYTEGANNSRRAHLIVSNNKFTRCGLAQSSAFFSEITCGRSDGIMIDVRDNEFIGGVNGLYAGLNQNATNIQTNRLAGWTLVPLKTNVANNKVSGQQGISTVDGRVSADCLRVDGSVISVVSDHQVSFINNRIEVSEIFPSTAASIKLRGCTNALVSGNTLVSQKEAGLGVRLQNPTNDAAIQNNNFTEYTKATGNSDVQIAAGCTTNEIKADPNDLIDDSGTDTDIVGGQVL